jgi:RNA polymerase sigma-70 factor (ECF subfamily)
MLDDDSIIEGCAAGKRSAQSALFNRYAPAMLAVCMRYARDREEAEDILQEAFLKIFRYISTFRKEGSFEGWMKRVMINHALNHYRKRRKMPFLEDIDAINETDILDREDPDAPHAPISAEKLTTLIQKLPPGYRMVFNMYVFEEFSHKEISMELNISENTSKTQLLKARRMLRKKINDLDLMKKTAYADE